MIYFLRRFLIIVILLFVTINVYAYSSRKDYFLRPQIGFWFGPITPLNTTEKVESIRALNTSLGGGLFLRYNSPFRFLKIGLDSSFHYFESEGVNKLWYVPVCGNFVYLLPFNLPLKIQLKAGAGGGWVSFEPDMTSQWDPIFMFGVEISFPAGRIVNIGLRIDYHLIYESYIPGGINGHIIDSGITLYFNL